MSVPAGLRSVASRLARAPAHQASVTPGVSCVPSALAAAAGGGAAVAQPSYAASSVLGGTRFANLKQVRNRMRSVSSISKITKAMKMVAAAKLRGVQARQEMSRPFAAGVREFFRALDDAEEQGGAPSSEAAEKRRLIVAITSDRGLCGGVNSSIAKAVREMLSPAKKDEHANSVMLVGDKGRDALQRTSSSAFAVAFRDVFKSPVSFAQSTVLAEEILAREYDEIVLVYNTFKSAISQVVTQQPIAGMQQLMDRAAVFDGYEFDSDMDSGQAFVDLFEFELCTQLFGALLENSTSEQAARMSAMDNATRNAGEMLQKLTLQYNRQRQAVITSELIEIISGAEAL